VAKINTLVDGDGVVSNCFTNFYLSNVNLLNELTFLFLYVMAIIENIVAILGNVVIALGDKMTITWVSFLVALE